MSFGADITQDKRPAVDCRSSTCGSSWIFPLESSMTMRFWGDSSCHPNPEFFGIIYPGFSRDPRKHGPRNISRPLKNRPRLSETPVDAVETRLLMGPQLARSPLFQAGLRAWPDGRTFQPPSQCSPHPFARPSSPAPTSSPATGGTRFRPQSAGRASAGPAAGAPSSSVSR